MAKKKTDAEAPAKTKKRQEYLPGTAPKKNVRIHAAAEDYAEIVSTRVSWTNKEKEAHERLMSIMLDEGETAYVYGDLTVILATGKAKVSVKIKSASDDETPKKKAAESDDDDNGDDE